MKGRPHVIPRIEALEQQLQAQYQMLITLENAVLELTQKVTDPNKPVTDAYQPQFTQWPKNGSS